jgi:hypothetical protein
MLTQHHFGFVARLDAALLRLGLTHQITQSLINKMQSCSKSASWQGFGGGCNSHQSNVGAKFLGFHEILFYFVFVA